PDSITLEIKTGTTASEIGILLEQNKIIKSSLAFDFYTRVNNNRSDLQAGIYEFRPSQSVQEIVRKLIVGDIASDLVTILPGQRLDQIVSSFTDLGYTPGEINEAFDPSNYKDHPILASKPASSTLEGYIFPESFQRTSATTLEDIIGAALDQTADAISADIIAALNNQGLSVHDAVIIASIVEREVDNIDDMPVVAQVFLKRYSEGIRLGSDITAIYGAETNGLELSVFADTPYNTRLYEGLPPGPVSNISRDAIRSVAFPSNSNYLYFVAGDDGVTYFSRTLAEHESLTRQHCIELCALY
ncbi:MAG: UPF0755 protein, partial [Candidatus Saccharimonadales bacterium]